MKEPTILIPFTVTEWRLIAVALFVASRMKRNPPLADAPELFNFAKRIAEETGKFTVDGRKF
jgi:hypothetical protein